MIRQLLFGGADIESIPANVGLAILRVFTGLSMALGHGLGKVPPSAGACGRYGKTGVSHTRVFRVGGRLRGVWRRAVAGAWIAHPAQARSLWALRCWSPDLASTRRTPSEGRRMALLYLAIAVMFLLVGSGKYGVDAWVRSWNPRS